MASCVQNLRCVTRGDFLHSALSSNSKYYDSFYTNQCLSEALEREEVSQFIKYELETMNEESASQY